MKSNKKAALPQYIIYVDYNGKGVEVTGLRVLHKALSETNILKAMCKAEEFIQEQGSHIYLVDIYEKTDKKSSSGEPLYKSAIMTRVHVPHGETVARPSTWHFRDNAHGEHEDGYYTWKSYGALSFYQEEDEE